MCATESSGRPSETTMAFNTFAWLGRYKGASNVLIRGRIVWEVRMARRMVVIVVATVIIALTFAPRAALTQEKKTERIAISELKKKLDSGEKFLLIDVREDREMKRDGAIPGAIHIPVAELDKRMKDIPKNIRLVFY